MRKNTIDLTVQAKDSASKTLNNVSESISNINGTAKTASDTSLPKMATAFGIAQVAADATVGVFNLVKDAIFGVVQAVSDYARSIIDNGLSISGMLETNTVGFKTLLGSAELAEETMARIKKEASRTPFTIKGLASATQLLVAVTKDGDRAIDLLLDVGESLASMGKGQEELDRIIVNLQQIGAVGKASMLDVKQFAFAGIPIFEMLKKETGLYGEELDKLISTGGVTFDLLERMFRSATDEGGQFFNAFVNQAGTYEQSLSNMEDSWDIFTSEFVKKTGIFDVAKELINGFSGSLSALEPVTNLIARGIGKVIETFVSIFNTIKEKAEPYIIKIREAFDNLQKRISESGLADKLERIRVKLTEAFSEKISNLINALLNRVVEFLDYLATPQGQQQIDKFVNSFVILADVIFKAISAIEKFFDLYSKFEKFKGDPFGLNSQINNLVRGQQFVNNLNAKNVGANFSQNLQRRATGGSVSAGTPYIVGEQGRELFIPRENGRIVPNNKTESMAQKTINIVNNFASYVDPEMVASRLAFQMGVQ